MNDDAARQRTTSVHISRWKVWLGTAVIVSACIFIFWYDQQDGHLEPEGLVILLLALGLSILGPIQTVFNRRPAVVIDQSGVSLEGGILGFRTVPFTHRFIGWEQIGEVRTRSFWAPWGIVLIPAAPPSENIAARLLRRSGIWPRPMVFDAFFLEVGAMELAQMIEEKRPRPSRLSEADTLGLNVHLR